MASRTIGENLRRARKLRGLKQAEVGAGIGVSSQYYGQMERGEKAISPDRLRALCKTLQIPLREALDGVTAHEATYLLLAEGALDERLLEVIQCLNITEKRLLLGIGQVIMEVL